MANSDIITEILTQIKCPVCFEYMSTPIYLCKEGHSICNNCKSNMLKCTTCLADLTDKRNYTVEGISNLLVQPCPYMLNGCTTKVKLSSLEEHKSICDYRTVRKCPFCETSSGFSISLGTVNSLLGHLVLAHGNKLLEGNQKKLIGNLNFSKAWKIVNFLYHQDNIFFLCNSFENSRIKCAVQCVGSKCKAEEYTFTFCLSSQLDNSNIQITHLCISDLQNPPSDSGQYITIPTDVIRDYKEPVFSIKLHNNTAITID